MLDIEDMVIHDIENRQVIHTLNTNDPNSWLIQILGGASFIQKKLS